MAEAPYVPLRPIPIKDRAGIVFLEYGQLDVIDGAFVLVDQTGVRVQIPVGGLACLMLEPGIRITHAAVMLAARVGCLLVWVGEAGVRLYAAGQPGGARADRLLYQARAALDETARLNVVRKMYAIRFGEDEVPARRSVDQLRGIEGARVKKMYQLLAKQYGVEWDARRYDPDQWDAADVPNRCLSAATACLYGLSEAAILAAGYAPAIGFLHRGKPQSFVYDIADIFKFETVVPVAFATAAQVAKFGGKGPVERQVRQACRDSFRRTRLLDRLIPTIHEVLAASGFEPVEDAPEGQAPALPNEVSGDAGHRG